MLEIEAIRSVLLVDADADHRAWLRGLLETGYTVLEASTPDEARHYPDAVQLDCVILDPLAFEDEGLDLVSQLSSEGCPVLAISEAPSAASAVEVMKRGAADYLMKADAEPEVVRAAVQRCVRDAAARRHAANDRASAHDHSKLFSDVLGAMPVGVCVLNASGTVRYLNDVARLILGQHIEDGRPLREVLRPADLFTEGTDQPYPLGRLPLFRALTGEISSVSDLEVDTGGLERRLVKMSASPLFDANEDVLFAVATFEDITQQSRLASQMRQAQRMESVGQLAGGVAHDFNNLLTIIYTCGSLALEGVEEGTDIRSDLREIVQTTARADRLTRQLLAFSRRQVVTPEVLDPNKVVTNLESMLRQAVGETVEMQLELLHGAWACKMDCGALEQVLLNLAVNARDAMPNGGTLSLLTDNLQVDAQYGARRRVVVPLGDYVRITVADTGSGISPNDLNRIFEPFFTTKGAGKGTGLGLATCYGLIKQAGGFIWVDSAPGVGTRFEVVLPRVRATPKGAVAAEISGQTAGSETILVAEDDRPVRRLTERILRRLGYRVLSAANGAEALHVAQDYGEGIDLLITDVLMPKMNGRELADRFLVQRPNTRVLYMSGWPDKVLWHHGVTESVDLLPKPFTPNLLGQRVRAALDGAA